jgi:hypothetical protein
MKSALPTSLWLTLALCGPAFAQPAPAAPAAPAEMISNYRLQHGEDRVTLDSTLNRIAREQAAAMASKDVLDQWIDSSEHRKNLLMHGASKVGVGSAKSARTGRTYWAMVIAGGYERSRSASPSAKPAKSRRAEQACRMKVLGLCL